MARESFAATVSELHLCHRCPRLAAYHIAGDSAAWRVGIEGNGNLRGRIFHDDIAAPFHRDAAGQGSKSNRLALAELLRTRADTLAGELPLFLRDHYLVPYLTEKSEQLTAVETVALAEGVNRWAGMLASFLTPILSENRSITRPAGIDDLIHTIFHPPEKLLRAEHIFSDGRRLKVSGRFDALLFDPRSGEACLIEFKGYKPSDTTRELTQTALYAWLVHRAVNVIPRACVLYLEDAGPPAVYDWDAIQSVMGNLPLLFDQMRRVIENGASLPRADQTLCVQCPHRSNCDSPESSAAITITTTIAPSTPAKPARKKKSATRRKSTGPAKTPPERSDAPSPADSKPPAPSTGPSPEDVAEAARCMADLIEKLGQLKLPVESAGYIVGPRFIQLRIVPDLSRGVTVKKLVGRTEDLQVAMSLKSAPLIRPRSGYVSVDIPRKVIVPLTLAAVLRQRERSEKPQSDGAFPLGVGIDGTVFWGDLAEPTMTSILIGGSAGSGKSYLLRSIVVGLGLTAPRGGVRFTLIDPKRVTFTDFDGLRCLDGPVLLDVEPAMQRLDSLVEEMEQRYLLLEKARVHDVVAYNARAKEKLPRLLVVIDEYADMIIDKTSRTQLETAIQRLGQKGRAAGLHLILATQRPDAKVVTGLIKANLQLKIALKVTSRTNSLIILDETGAEYLIGHGDMLVGGSCPIQRLQGPLVSKTELDLLREKYESAGH